MIREEESSSEEEGEEGISSFLADQVAIVYDVNFDLIPGGEAGWRKALQIEMEQDSPPELNLRKRFRAAAKRVLANLNMDRLYYKRLDEDDDDNMFADPRWQMHESPHGDYGDHGGSIPIVDDDDDDDDDDDPYGGSTQEWVWSLPNDEEEDSQATLSYYSDDENVQSLSSDDDEEKEEKEDSQATQLPSDEDSLWWDLIEGKRKRKDKGKKKSTTTTTTKDQSPKKKKPKINITGPNDLFPALRLHKEINFDDDTTACVFGQLDDDD